MEVMTPTVGTSNRNSPGPRVRFLPGKGFPPRLSHYSLHSLGETIRLQIPTPSAILTRAWNPVAPTGCFSDPWHLEGQKMSEYMGQNRGLFRGVGITAKCMFPTELINTVF